MRNQVFAIRAVSLLFAGTVLIVSPKGQAGEFDAAAPAAAKPSPDQIRLGLDLFQGKARFSAGGPSCNACHNVVNDAVVGGGTLAADLTESFGRVGAEGVMAMLPREGSPSPFPVMQAAYQNHPLAEAESQALVAFLQDANDRHAAQKPNDLGPRMLAAGVGGVVVLMLLFAFLGRGRKRKSVNQAIYDRQTVGG